MKRLTTLFLVLLVLMLLAGCGEATDSGKKATRDTSTLDKAIMGHWVTSDGFYDVYITERTITSYYGLKGESSSRGYLVGSMDEESRVICLNETIESNGINETTYYQLSPDYESMRAYRDAGLQEPRGDVPYDYVDGQTSP